MISPTRRKTSDRCQDGFTLLEMLVVLALLGITVGLMLQRGPLRSPTVELRATAGEVARALRQARARAVATNQSVAIMFDVPGYSYAVDGGTPRRLPADLSIWFTSVTPGARSGGMPGIGFAPDGSSSGGLIKFSAYARTVEVTVDWLTGRVGLSPVRSTDAR